MKKISAIVLIIAGVATVAAGAATTASGIITLIATCAGREGGC